MHKSLRAVWEIYGLDGARECFRAVIPSGQITRLQLHALLRTLAAKHGLTDEEIVDCHLKRNVCGYRAHLEVASHNDDATRTTSYSCGDDPHFHARPIPSP